MATSVAAGLAECPTGGSKVTLFTDLNNDGVANQDEPAHDIVVCNGAPGINSLVLVSEEPAGDNCPTGGQKLETGLDMNANGILELDENPAVTYVCNGATGNSSLIDVQAGFTGGLSDGRLQYLLWRGCG